MSNPDELTKETERRSRQQPAAVACSTTSTGTASSIQSALLPGDMLQQRSRESRNRSTNANTSMTSSSTTQKPAANALNRSANSATNEVMGDSFYNDPAMRKMLQDRADQANAEFANALPNYGLPSRRTNLMSDDEEGSPPAAARLPTEPSKEENMPNNWKNGDEKAAATSTSDRMTNGPKGEANSGMTPGAYSHAPGHGRQRVEHLDLNLVGVTTANNREEMAVESNPMIPAPSLAPSPSTPPTAVEAVAPLQQPPVPTTSSDIEPPQPEAIFVRHDGSDGLEEQLPGTIYIPRSTALDDTIPEATPVPKPEHRRMVMMAAGVLVLVLLVVAVVVSAVVVTSGNGSNTAANQNEAPVSEATYATYDDLIAIGQDLFPNAHALPDKTWAAWEDASSTSAQALMWLSQDPRIDSYDDPKRLQRLALASFYHAMNGPEWQDQQRNKVWMNYDVDECDWTPVQCNEQGQVTGLPMASVLDQGLQGALALPVELVLLTELKVIRIAEMMEADNVMLFEDFFASDLHTLSNLQVLQCTDCGLHGPVPSYLGQLVNLKRLDLARNFLGGSLSEVLGILSPSSSSLTHLMLSTNALIGTLPPTLLQFANLVQLSLSDNFLTGALSSELGQFTNLKVLELGHVAIDGTINVDKNYLPLPFQLGNKFNATIPTQLGQLSGLDRLILGNANLQGPIPTELGLLSSLESDLHLQNNRLTGTLPPLQRWTNLVHFYAHGNLLSGSIPPSIGQMSKLEHLQLQDNRLSGTLPEQMGKISGLTLCLLRDNANMTPPIPTSMCTDTLLFQSHFQTNWCGNIGNFCC